jgi:hypothetical protein
MYHYDRKGSYIGKTSSSSPYSRYDGGKAPLVVRWGSWLVIFPTILHTLVFQQGFKKFSEFYKLPFPHNFISGAYYIIVIVPVKMFRGIFAIPRQSPELNVVIGLVLCLALAIALVYVFFKIVQKPNIRVCIFLFVNYGLPWLALTMGPMLATQGRSGSAWTWFGLYAMVFALPLVLGSFLYFAIRDHYESNGFDILPEWDNLDVKAKLITIGLVLIGLR